MNQQRDDQTSPQVGSMVGVGPMCISSGNEFHTERDILKHVYENMWSLKSMNQL